MRRLFLLAFIWGWSFLFIKVAGHGLTPSAVAFGRIALGAVVLHVVLQHRRERLPRDLTSWRHFFVASVFGNAVPFTLLAWGEQHITSALTAVLNASTPLFTAALAAVALRERLRWVQVAGLGFGLVGVGVASGVGVADVASSSLGGSLASVGAGLCYGIAFVYMRHHLVGHPPIIAAAGQLTAGAVVVLPLAVVTSVREGVAFTPTRVASIVLLGAVGTGIAYVLNYRVLAELGATRASLVTYAVPVVAVAVGIAVLDEPFELRQLLGGLLIVGGIGTVHTGWRPRFRRADVVAVTGRTAGVLLLVTAVLAGCTDDDGTRARGTDDPATGTEATCDTPQREELDERFLTHVLPGAADPGYRSDPPTSGPHQPAPSVRGVVEDPLSRPVQVGILEEGRILVQHRGTRPPEELRSLASDDVVVAPNPDLRSAIVVTAWLWKLRCDGPDSTAISEFVAAHRGEGPGH